ncbi:helix-turn-helix transcriptional regulator [Roseobacter sp. HKCCD9010]|jgi:DNA-binding CsgD family transcriptional regulator|uniref:helix-turn-helix transcriptional regulator n=1 Tax=Rhodobacterales TaxID=204455 RepID=UPI00119995FF|nr:MULTISPECIES: helix-turn-helix transcriptional regulator [Rhodobacterales]MBF9051537.1 helix-turn-helix transcriptional regulator [Rhodobacterales bacterium HKCCD4356]NNV13061.1 helix-turn-helix transcriptional regulator [Roseobacter sp. HKCCD7357]NNV17312.1 helix-turn-helix transcriptional regulator [Roseobacter sp. HKCCD8768]NNV26918.1 helix-turn-helix transcriptional regulator [Roseobacter sp. HKCCD8192]NNV31038.1 helix-turn-helix transcriptional regulator [Roseobacter sp. HKCCD9061]
MLRRPVVFVVILVVQLLCAVFFVSEIMMSVLGLPFAPIPWQVHELIEIGAGVGLILGVVLGALLLRSALRRTRAAERALRAASGAFMDLVEERFDEWKLTPAERDVALFALKGMSLSEIAALRATSEGTVKAQTNAIYRKAGVTGRPQLLSVFVDDLMGDGVVAAE